jgi:multiple sugar transport system substrate-binding protein
MRRWFSLSMSLGFIISLILVSCSQKSNTADTVTTEESYLIQTFTQTSPSAERVKIRWFIGVGTGRTTLAVQAAKEFASHYNDSQDKIEVELEVVTTNTHDAVDQLTRKIMDGNAPDIVGPADTWASEQLNGHILYLDPLLATYDLSGIDQKLLNSWRVEGQITGLPLGTFPSVIFYNKELFDAARLPYPPHRFAEPYGDGDPWTIEKMEALALLLTRDSNGRNATDPDFDPNQITQWGFHWQWDSTRSMVAMFGAGTIVGENGDAVVPQHWRQAFNWYYDGMWKKHFIPFNSQVSLLQSNPFASGKVAMVHSFMWYAPRLSDVTNWDLAAVPAYNGKITSRMERDGMIVLNTTQHPVEAVDVAYAIANSPELLAAWDMLPAFKNMQADWIDDLAAKQPDVDWRVMLDSLAYADTTYDNAMPNYRKSYDRLLAFRDLIGMYGTLDLEEEIKKLEAELTTLFLESTPTP